MKVILSLPLCNTNIEFHVVTPVSGIMWYLVDLDLIFLRDIECGFGDFR